MHVYVARRIICIPCVQHMRRREICGAFILLVYYERRAGVKLTPGNQRL